MKSKILKRIIACMTTVPIVICFTLVVSADSSHYKLLGYPNIKFSTYQYCLTYNYYKNGNIDWGNYIHDGLTAWNVSGAKIYITKTTGGSNLYITSGNYGNLPWDGLTTPPNANSSNPNYAVTKINDYSVNRNGSGWQAELVAHETGHVLLLDDISSSYCTLMRNSGYNGSPNPTPSDITGVNVNYN